MHTFKARVGRVALHTVLIILSMAVILPFLLMVSVSFSSEKDVVTEGYKLIPKNFDLSAYKYVFETPEVILRAYGVTIFSTIAGTLLGLVMMTLIAYPLSRKDLPGKQGVSFILFFTMLFSGGLAATYIVITKYYHLGDTLWVYILPAAVSPWHVFMIRTFFSGVPEEMIESARLDGAGEYRILFQMVLPISTPVLATVGLMTSLGRWNDWQTSMLYITDPDLISLQYFLQRIMENLKVMQRQMLEAGSKVNVAEIPGETARMAMAVVAAGPMIFIFPFLQKYFVKGLTIGSVKG